jgi:hypothetical protein
MQNHISMIINRNLRTSWVSILLILLAFLIFPAAIVSAQSVWSGNASVDNTELVNFLEDFPLSGASSAFPRNTKILVTNPQNNKSVEVTIVKRSPRPGVFLVLTEDAGKKISLTVDQVIPVQVSVVNDTTTNAYDEFKSIDPDINPAVSVPEAEVPDAAIPSEADTVDSAEGVEPSETAKEDNSIPVLGSDLIASEPVFDTEPVPVPLPMDNLRVEREDPALTEATSENPVVDVTAAVEESPVAILPEELPAETEPEVSILTDADEISESLRPTGDNVIYFLTPSDFRPPTGPVTVRDDTEEIVPVLVERTSLERFIVSQLNNGSSYIQLGAYRTPESVYEEITSIEARYPMIVWTEIHEGRTLYKLLIGPLTRDETGVLSYRFRDSGYSDLFLYKP